jgi:endonuclease/exonuclease/phosphatase family metal-dependent hydrolase
MRIYSHNIWGNFSSKECIGNRNYLIKELIDGVNPDFCCFQECNPSTSRFGETSISKLLLECYEEVSFECAEKNFTPVFYKKNKFKLLDSSYVIFNGLNDWNSKSFTWGLFEEIETMKKVIIISVHLWWQYRGEVDIIQRRENVSQLMEVINRLFAKYNAPIIVAGDFNSGVNAKQGPDAYNVMVKNDMLDVRNISRETVDTETCASVYPLHTEDGIYYNGSSPSLTIDYIFLNKEELVKSLKFNIINSQKAKDSSDHLPLIYEFEIL